MAASSNGTFDEMCYSLLLRCKLCEKSIVNPQVLSCLHVLCEKCLMYSLYAAKDNLKQNEYSIDCPDCKKTVTIGLSAIGTAMKPSQSTEKGVTCVEHDKECKYYCYKCEILACVYCLTKNHDDHPYASISEAENVVRDQIQKQLEDGKDNTEQCYETISCLLEALTDLRSKHAFERAELTSTFRNFMKLCDSFYDDATKDLNAAHLKRENKVKALLDEIKTFTSNIDRSCKSAKKLFMEADSYALCKLRDTNATQFSELNSIPPIRVETVPDNREEKTVQMILDSFNEKMQFSVDAFVASIVDKPLDISKLPEAESNWKLPVSNGFFSSLTNHFKRTPLPMFMKHRFGALGTLNVQFHNPNGFCFDAYDDIIIADTYNHRIQIFHKNGDFKFKFGMPGKMDGHLWFPSKVAAIRNGNRLVVADQGIERLRLQIFSENGIFIKRIPFFNVSIVAAIEVTTDGHIVIVDKSDAFVCIVNESGELIRSFECRNYVCDPSDVAVHGTELFICDFKGQCVAVFSMDGAFRRFIGNKDVVSYPSGIHVTESDVFVSDSDNSRFHVARFTRNGLFKASYVCSQIKVTHCNGFKMNSDGEAFTLSKKYHYMLVFDEKTFEQQS